MEATVVVPKYSMLPRGAHGQNATLSTVQVIPVPLDANAVLLSCIAQSVLFTLEGTDPTSTKGLTLEADRGAILLPVVEGQILKFIEAAASATLNYQFVELGEV